MPKGGKKRSEPSSSSEESPPKPQGAVGSSPGSGKSPKQGSSTSPDKVAAADPSPSKPSPKKLDEIAQRHVKSRSKTLKTLTKEQIAEMGLRIFQKWVWLRQKCRRKSGAAAKKSKIEIAKEHEDKLAAEKPKTGTEEEEDEDEPEGAAAPKESRMEAEEEHEDVSFPMDVGLPDMEILVNEEVRSLEDLRFEAEVESITDGEGAESEESEEERAARLIQVSWGRYLFRREAMRRHAALEMMVITAVDSAFMLDRLTEAMSELRLRISEPSSPAHRPEELQTFFNDLELARNRMKSRSSSDESLKRDAPGPSGIKKFERKSPPRDDEDDDEKSTRL